MRKPKISPISMSVWLDAKNNKDWNWSVHADSRVVDSGKESDYNEAIKQAKNAFVRHPRMQMVIK